EALRTWNIVLRAKAISRTAMNALAELLPVVIRQLEFARSLSLLEHRNKFDWQYCASLITAITEFVRARPFTAPPFNNIAEICVCKWLWELMNNNIVPEDDVQVTISCFLRYIRLTKCTTNPLK